MKWEKKTAKQETEYYITNGEYVLYLGDAFYGPRLKFSSKKDNKLSDDADRMCYLLNRPIKGDLNE